MWKKKLGKAVKKKNSVNSERLLLQQKKTSISYFKRKKKEGNWREKKENSAVNPSHCPERTHTHTHTHTRSARPLIWYAERNSIAAIRSATGFFFAFFFGSFLFAFNERRTLFCIPDRIFNLLFFNPVKSAYIFTSLFFLLSSIIQLKKKQTAHRTRFLKAAGHIEGRKRNDERQLNSSSVQKKEKRKQIR